MSRGPGTGTVPPVTLTASMIAAGGCSVVECSVV